MLSTIAYYTYILSPTVMRDTAFINLLLGSALFWALTLVVLTYFREFIIYFGNYLVDERMIGESVLTKFDDINYFTGVFVFYVCSHISYTTGGGVEPFYYCLFLAPFINEYLKYTIQDSVLEFRSDSGARHS